MVKHVKEFPAERNSIGQKNSRSSTVPEDFGEIFMLFRKIWNSLKIPSTPKENWNRMWSHLCHESRKRAGVIQLSRRLKYLHKCNNAMNFDGKLFQATTKFIRRFHEHNIELNESQRCRIQESVETCHEDHSADKGVQSFFKNYYDLVHNPTLIPRSMKIPYSQAAVDKEWNTKKELVSLARISSTKSERSYGFLQKERKTWKRSSKHTPCGPTWRRSEERLWLVCSEQ